MNKSLFRVLAFLRHMIYSRSRYRIHSPWVYTFCTEVLPHKRSGVGNRIEERRKILLKSDQWIRFVDYGAGPDGQHVRRKVSEMVHTASRKRRSGELLYRICRHYKPRRGLELGTHLGLATMYQVAGGIFERFVTLDGAANVVEIAQSGFEEWTFQPECITGPFEETLFDVVDLTVLKPDYVFVDGNHQYEPAMRYFHHLLPYMADGAIMIWDDIYWSKDMQKAWNEIIRHPEVTVSIDIFFLGICLVRHNQAKEHFRLRFLDGNF